MFKTLQKIFTPKTWLIAGGVLALGLCFGVDMAWAQEITGQNTPSNALEGFATLATMLIKVLTFLAFLLMSFGGKLMSSELLLEGASVEAIRSMWVVVRNITNIGFVLVLLFLV